MFFLKQSFVTKKIGYILVLVRKLGVWSFQHLWYVISRRRRRWENWGHCLKPHCFYPVFSPPFYLPGNWFWKQCPIFTHTQTRIYYSIILFGSIFCLNPFHADITPFYMDMNNTITFEWSCTTSIRIILLLCAQMKKVQYSQTIINNEIANKFWFQTKHHLNYWMKSWTICWIFLSKYI